MDYHALQHKLFAMDPSDPKEDLAKLQAYAQNGGADVPPTKDYVTESVEVPQGSMPLGIDSISDFAALAGVQIDEKQKHADYAKGSDRMPRTEPGRTKHPLKDKLVGEDDNTDQNPQIDKLIQKYMTLFDMPENVARRLAQVAYMEFKPVEMPSPPTGNNKSRFKPVEMPSPPTGNNNSRFKPVEMPSPFESIKERLYKELEKRTR